VRAYEMCRTRRGPVPEGTPYLVLERFRGRPAHRAVVPGHVAPPVLEGMAGQLLDGLSHLHAAEYVHRDIKPGNVLVALGPDGAPRVKLTDFGLATPAGTAGEPGQVDGSILYVAPESILGDSVDGRADLYAVGILFYYLATGRLPVESSDTHDILRWHVRGAPVDPRVVAPQLPERFARFVHRLTERRPMDRPASAAEALGLLGGNLTFKHGPPRPVPRAETAALRLALDAVRLGRVRRVKLPWRSGARLETLRTVRVGAETRGLAVLPLGQGRCGTGIGRLVLRLLYAYAAQAHEIALRYRLSTVLPLAFLGGHAVWDRARAESSAEPGPEETAAAAARVVSFLLEEDRRGPVVIEVRHAALDDPLARAVIAELTGRVERDPATPPLRAGLLLLAHPERRRGGTGPPRLDGKVPGAAD
jgi:hypothetical protein